MNRSLRDDQTTRLLGYVELGEGAEPPPLRLPAGEPSIMLTNGRVFANKPAWSDGQIEILLIGAVARVDSDRAELATRAGGQEASIAQLYRAYGAEFANRIDGQFLVILFDRRDGTLRIINDAYQARNLYYYLDRSRLVFATSLAGLLDAIPSRPAFDPSSIPSFLSTGFSSSERTPFRDVYHLLPAHSIECVGRVVSLSDRWRSEYRVNRQPIVDLEGKLDEYERRFSSSIEHFLTSTGSTEPGCLLSGGHDTSLVFLHTSKLTPRPTHAFTVSFSEWGFDESPKARYLTERVGGVHHRVEFGPQHLDLLPRVVEAMEEPSTSTSLPLYVCIQEMANYTDAVLSGDGGDTLWDEYYPISEIHRYVRHLPARARRLLHTLSRVGRDATDSERLWELEHVLALFTPNDMYDDFFRRLLTYRHYGDDVLRELLDPGAFPRVEFQGNRLEIPIDGPHFAEGLIEAKMFYGVYQYLVPHAQKAAEASGIGFHSPYLNRDLIHFVSALPRDWLNGGSSLRKVINDAYKRRFHKQVLLRYLPPRYVFSQQQSFDVPYQVVFAKRPELLDRLLRRLERRGWYDSRTLNRIFGEFRSASYKPHEIFELKSHAYRIFTLLTLEIWCTRFLDGRRPDLQGPPAPLEEYLA